ncbi:MAG: TonB-dependent receptor, partial [Psychrobacter sp.]
AQYDSTRHSTRLTGYRSDVDNLIAYSNFKAKNINSAKIEGISLTSDWEMNDYLLGGSYDYQKAEDSSGGSDDGNSLPYRPEHKGLVYVGYRLPSLDIRAEYQYVGDYYSRITNTDSQFVDNYGLLNISGNYKLTDNLSMTARLNNITNEEYITDIGYNTDGINYFTSLTYNWY